MWVVEQILHRDPEDGGQAEGQVEGRIVLFGFNRVDGLAGDAGALAEVRLAPAAFRPQRAQSIFHQRVSGVTTATTENEAHGKTDMRKPGSCGACAWASAMPTPRSRRSPLVVCAGA